MLLKKVIAILMSHFSTAKTFQFKSQQNLFTIQNCFDRMWNDHSVQEFFSRWIPLLEDYKHNVDLSDKPSLFPKLFFFTQIVFHETNNLLQLLNVLDLRISIKIYRFIVFPLFNCAYLTTWGSQLSKLFLHLKLTSQLA